MSKEIKAGIIGLLAIGLLVGGVNFLKGNSFFGGDDTYIAYFPDSGGLAPSSSVYINGVPVGKILSVDYNMKGDSLSRVKISFNIQEDELRIPRGSRLEIGSIGLMDKGLVIKLNKDLSKGYYSFNERIRGTVSQDIATQLKAYADPINQKLQALMTTVDKTVTSLQGFWDETATTEIEGSMKELRNSISRLGNVAIQVEDLVATEKVKLGRIFSNVESISANLKASNDKIESIIGNTKKITDDLVSADYKAVIMDAQNSIKKLNVMLEDINNGHGTLGKLVKDEKLYNELVETNNDLQNLLKDLELHPERYIHFSVLGARTKGANFTPSEEKKIRQVIDTIPE